MSKSLVQPYQVWFPGELVWELWFVDHRNRARMVDTCEDSRLLKFKRNRRRKVLALPAGNQTPLTFSSNAFGEGRLLKGAFDSVKMSDLSCDSAGIGVQPICGYPPNTLARIDAPATGKRLVEFPDELCPDLIVPAASLLPIPSDDIAIWTELGKTVLSVEKSGHTIYYKELDGSRSADCTREIRQLLPELRKKGIVSRSSAIHVWCRNGFDVYKTILTIPVNAGYRTDPVNLKPVLGMRPVRFRENDERRSLRRKRTARNLSITGITALTILVVSCAYYYAWMQMTNHRDCIVRLQPEAERLDFIKSQWEEMAPAVDRNASILETWRKLFTMPNSPEVNIQRMAIAKDKVELICQAPTSTAALRYIDDLAKTTSLATFAWDYTTPEILQNGTALITIKGFRK